MVVRFGLESAWGYGFSAGVFELSCGVSGVCGVCGVWRVWGVWGVYGFIRCTGSTDSSYWVRLGSRLGPGCRFIRVEGLLCFVFSRKAGRVSRFRVLNRLKPFSRTITCTILEVPSTLIHFLSRPSTLLMCPPAPPPHPQIRKPAQ